MKIIVKILSIVFIILFSINSFSYSAGSESIKDRGDSFLQAGTTVSAPDPTGMKDGINDIAGILTGIGVALVVIVGVVLGIQFMMGGMEEQAKIKQALIPYAIGSVVIFGALGIWQIVVRILNSAT